jgi:multidrug efflux pump subunit AcrA (membrane-fusion protein)
MGSDHVATQRRGGNSAGYGVYASDARPHAPGRPFGGWGARQHCPPAIHVDQKEAVSGIFALTLVAAGVFFIFQANRGSRAETQKSAPVVPVTAVGVLLKTVPVRLLAIGNVEPFTSVAIKARVDGQLVSVKFKEGDEVRQGAVLFEIDVDRSPPA